MSQTVSTGVDASLHYLEHVGRFTVLHAQDLIQLLKTEITSATSILDIGCGPGVFGLAYLEAFPKGISGQTIWCTDLSPGMVDCARKILGERVPPDYLTRFEFQVEDGSELKGIPDTSIDIVISIFGIFLIPDYCKSLGAIRRVLHPSGVLGMTTWTMSQQRQALEKEGFGPSFHQVIEETLQELTSLCDKSTDSPNEPPWKRWFKPKQIEEMMVDQAGYNASSLQILRSLHSITWSNPDAFWSMIETNPNTKLGSADSERVQGVKKNLMDALSSTAMGVKSSSKSSSTSERPVIVVTASNLILARP